MSVRDHRSDPDVVVVRRSLDGQVVLHQELLQVVRQTLDVPTQLEGKGP